MKRGLISKIKGLFQPTRFIDKVKYKIEVENSDKVDDSISIDFEDYPQILPDTIRYVVEKWGKDYLLTRGFINVLNDFKALKDIPAAKHIITNMQTNGYIEKIALAQNWELESKSIVTKYANEFGTREDIVYFIVQSIGYGLKKCLAVPQITDKSEEKEESFDDPEVFDEPAVFDNPEDFDDPEVFDFPASHTINLHPSTSTYQTPPINPTTNPLSDPLEPFNPYDDLPNYQYPTLSLLSDRRADNDNVYVKSVLQRELYQKTLMELPCALGKKEDGSILIFDLAEAPHLMISGASGMGVSVCFNAIITSLLYKKHPAEMKFILIDPKKIEFSLYSPLEKYFLAALPDNEAVITDMGEAYRTLRSVDKLMTVRLNLFKEAAVRDIKSYNRKFCERKIMPRNGHGFMPYLVVLIDEYDELIRSCGKGIETFLESIARMGRATGIHLVLSVQRPVATVISAGIKANIPSRISFRVTSASDSRNILGISGAEKLQRPGEMIYTNGIEVYKSKCAYMDIQEVERVNDFISNQKGFRMAFELPDPDKQDSDDWWNQDVDMQHLDPLFEDAARLVVINQSGSTSLIQRKFAIGYNRAGRLMAQLEKAGIVGAAYGSKPREVMIQDEISLNNLLNKLRY